MAKEMRMFEFVLSLGNPKILWVHFSITSTSNF